jgi:hypothetical protein
MLSSLSHIVEILLPYPVERWAVTAVRVFENRRAKVAWAENGVLGFVRMIMTCYDLF